MSKAKILAVLLLAVFPVSAGAQGPRLGVYHDAAGTQPESSVPAFTTNNDVFVVVSDLPDFHGFEFQLTFDPSLVIFDSQNLIAPGLIHVQVADPPGNWIVSLVDCVTGGSTVALVKHTYGYFVDPLYDALICVGPATPSSLPSIPAYYDCANMPQPFLPASTGGTYPDACAVVNPSLPDCPPIEGVYHLGVDDVTAPAGAEVDLPIAVYRDFTKCSYVVPYVDRIALRLTYDETVADFVSATPHAPVTGWTVTATAQAGQVDLELTGPAVDSGTSSNDVWLDVRFAVSAQGGVTAVTTSNEVAELQSEQAIWTVVGSEGSITTVPVAAETVSFGAVKARFGGR